MNSTLEATPLYSPVQYAEPSGPVQMDWELGDYPFADQMDYYNALVARSAEARTDSDMTEEVQKLIDNNDRFTAYVEQNKATTDQIAEKYKQADAYAESIGATPEQHAAIRISMFDSLVATSDMDGTLTVDPNSYLELTNPGAAVLEPMVKGNEHEYEKFFVHVLQPYLGRESDNLRRQGGQQVPVREGVNGFFEYMNQQESPVTILSLSPRAFVEGVTDQFPAANANGNLQIIATEQHSLLPRVKGSVLMFQCQLQPDHARIFLGDGFSDEPATKARDVIAFYFALKDSSFDRLLTEKGILHFTYDNFDDVTNKLKEIEALRQELEPDFQDVISGYKSADYNN